MSFGNLSERGDGLDEDARWIDARMDPAQPADGVLQFPKGAVIVKSSGNAGNTTPVIRPRRQTAKFTVPAGGLTVPIELKDSRGGLDDKWKRCGRNTHTPSVGVIFWYRRAAPATAVKFAVRLPHRAAFSADQEVGNTFETSFRVNPPIRLRRRYIRFRLHAIPFFCNTRRTPRHHTLPDPLPGPCAAKECGCC